MVAQGPKYRCLWSVQLYGVHSAIVIVLVAPALFPFATCLFGLNLAQRFPL
jgi:hypothetical protein